jgi:hypothetical protein
VIVAGIVCVHTCQPDARRFVARTTSTASGPFSHPVKPPLGALSRSWQHGITASRDRAAVASSITASVSPPHAWTDTTTSSSRSSTCASDASNNVTRPRSFGHSVAMARASVEHDAGSA